MWYIKETEETKEILGEKAQKFPLIFKKILYIIKNKLCIVNVKEIEDKIICIIPFVKENKITPKIAEKISNKINKLLDKNNVKNVVLSEHLNSIETLVNSLQANNINILDGRWLFKYEIIDIVKYIAETSNKKVENLKISILINDKHDVDEQNITLLANTVKSVNIVTNHINEYKNLEERLQNDAGIIITISNNTKKSLLKSDVIINIDFPEETINKYTLPKNVVLVNIEGKTNIQSKKFSGINVNFYNIILSENIIRNFIENNLYNAFNSVVLYESIIFRKDNFKNIREDIQKDKVKIRNLIGNAGEINEEEFAYQFAQKS